MENYGKDDIKALEERAEHAFFAATMAIEGRGGDIAPSDREELELALESGLLFRSLVSVIGEGGVGTIHVPAFNNLKIEVEIINRVLERGA